MWNVSADRFSDNIDPIGPYNFSRQAINSYIYIVKIAICEKSLWFFICFGSFSVQVNLCKKLLFLHQLTHNMTTDCSLNKKVQYMKIPSSEHGENKLCTWIVFDIQNNFCTQRQHVLPMFWQRKTKKIVDKNWKLRTCSEHVVYTNCSSFMFCHSEHSMYTTCSEHVLSLQFSCTELVIQWTIFCHILG